MRMRMWSLGRISGRPAMGIKCLVACKADQTRIKLIIWSHFEAPDWQFLCRSKLATFIIYNSRDSNSSLCEWHSNGQWLLYSQEVDNGGRTKLTPGRCRSLRCGGYRTPTDSAKEYVMR